MSDQPKKSNFFEKLATFIVDKRNLIFFLYAIAIIASLITQSWVKVCDDLTQYLPETTETRRGLTLMEDEMKTYGTARIIVSHVTYEIARDLADQIEDLNNISSVDFWDADKSADDTTLPSAANKTYEDYMQGADALITVTFRGENDDQSAKDGLAAVKELLAPAGFGHISVTTAQAHDEMIAFTSQMPHLISNAYIKSPTAAEHKGFSAGSYKDMTRVAWLNAPMWAELFLENRDCLLRELGWLMESLREYRAALEKNDLPELTRLLEEGKKRKEEVDGR